MKQKAEGEHQIGSIYTTQYGHILVATSVEKL